MKDLREIYMKLKEDLRSTKGRNVLTFLVFLVISAVFWLMLALNDEVQQDYKLPIQLIDFPEDLTILSGDVETLDVTIKDKGSTLAKFNWGNTPELKLRYDEFSHSRQYHMLYTGAQLSSALRGIFGSNSTIVAMRPDSLDLNFTTFPGVPVALTIDAEVHTLPQFIAYGEPYCDVDSVKLYSNLKGRFSVHSVSTLPISLSDLNDTATVVASIEAPEGMRVVPSSVTVKIPVEPLVSKTRKITLETRNVPSDSRLVPFPAVVEVTYLLPKSLYNTDSHTLKAYVNYERGTSAKTLPVKIVGAPSYYKGLTVTPSSVEFVIEHK